MNGTLMKKNSRLILSTMAMIGIASIFGAIAYISISNPDLIATQSDSEDSSDDGEENDAVESTSGSEEPTEDGETNDAVESTTTDSEVSTGDNETSDDAESSTD